MIASLEVSTLNQHSTAAVSIALLASLTLSACSRQSEAPQPAEQSPPSAQASQPVTAAGTFQIGEFSATVLPDGELDFPNDNKTFGVGRTPEELAQVLRAAGLPTDKLSLAVRPLLVKTSDRVLLFDTGAGTNFGPGAGALAKSMADAGIDAVTVTDIFISHPHGDHVGGLVNAEGALAFPNATIHISAADWALLQGLNTETSASIGLNEHTKFMAAVTAKVAAFEPGADLIPGVVKAVEIRGHTPGHSGFQIGSGDSSVLYIGDAMHHSIVSVQKPDWTIAFDRDAPTAQASRKELLARSAASGQRIYAVHFPFPGIGKFEKRGEEFVWVAE
jgi:glyoxylase-like metal-dependent hydrolase (beta-lactamase superfamily II)